jgi:hypothetical protein
MFVNCNSTEKKKGRCELKLTLEHNASYQLREELGSYIAHFEGENGDIGGKNGYILGVNV